MTAATDRGTTGSGATDSGADQPVDPAEAIDPRTVRRLLRLVARLRRLGLGVAPSAAEDAEQPHPDEADELAVGDLDDLDLIRRTAVVRITEGMLVESLFTDGDLHLAAVRTTRELMRVPDGRWRARAIMRALRREPGMQATAALCGAVIRTAAGDRAGAWAILEGLDRALVQRLAPGEYLLAGVATGAPGSLERVGDALDDVPAAGLSASAWRDLARALFLAGAEALSARALDAACAGTAGLADRELARQITDEAQWLRDWFGRAEAAAAVPALAPGEVGLALVDTKQPQRSEVPADLGHAFETLAVVAQLAKRPGVAVRGDTALCEVVEQARAGVAPAARRPGEAVVRLSTLDRNAAAWSPVPAGSWALVHGPVGEAVFGRRDLAGNPRLHPLYVAVTIASSDALTPDVVEHLRACAPIGCRDLSTALLLTAAGVPAFRAGDLTVLLGDLVGAPVPTPERRGILFVDVPPDGRGRRQPQLLPGVPDKSLAENLTTALTRLTPIHRAEHVVTSRPHAYLPALAVGTPARFVPRPDTVDELELVAPRTPAEFAEDRDVLAHLVDTVLDEILAGADEDAVRALWRDLCAPAVAQLRRSVDDLEPVRVPDLDVAALCASVLAGAVTVERSEPGPPGPEVVVEMSLDRNYRHQLGVVLESIVAGCSRPLRAVVLCRGLDAADRDRFAAAFPTVSFLWLPTDEVDYGDTALLAHITVATMDRLLLPALLPDVPRIIHHDLDAVTVGDLATLFDLDLAGAPLAARADPFPGLPHGFAAFRATAHRMAARPELGRELMRRIAGRHRFDMALFNAGVMVLDLERMRADRFTETWVPFAVHFGLHDQDTLLAYAGSTRAALPEVWNTVAGVEDIEQAELIHWAGKVKPWNHEIWTPGREVWADLEARLAQRWAATGTSGS